MSETLIIGAGPAGLTAAYELSKLGIGSTVLEADEQVGGLSRTVGYRGYRFDIGGHRFFSKSALINEVWREILGEEFVLRPRMSRIHYRDRFFDYPLTAFGALAGLGPVESLLVVLSYAKAKLRPHRPETDFEQWVGNRFGHRLYSIFFKTYTEKVWGIPCREISADWAAQRIMDLSLLEALRNALLPRGGTARDGTIITTLIDQFHYPRFGPGQMWESCESLLRAGGNKTIRGVKADAIRHRNGRVECVRGRTALGEIVEFSPKRVISSMPLRSLARAMDPPAPDEVLRAADRLRYRDYLTAVLIVDRADVFPDNWIYIHTPDVKMGRIQNYKNWSPQMVPDPAKTSLGLEYFLWDRDEEWSWPDERLIELGTAECARLGLIEPGEVEDATVVRMRKAYPVYDHGYRENVETIRRYIDGIENLQTVGRNGQHRYNNQDHSMLTGICAARNVAGQRYDVWNVNVEKAYHEDVDAGVPTVSAPGADRAIPQRIGPRTGPDTAAADRILAEAFARLDPIALGIAVGIVGGAGVFLASVVLLVKGGQPVGPNLSLLGHYLIGFNVSWTGAVVGLCEAGVIGFAFGYLAARLMNACVIGYAHLVRRRAQARKRKRMLEEI